MLGKFGSSSENLVVLNIYKKKCLKNLAVLCTHRNNAWKIRRCSVLIKIMLGKFSSGSENSAALCTYRNNAWKIRRCSVLIEIKLGKFGGGSENSAVLYTYRKKCSKNSAVLCTHRNNA
jgi:hypothetical protein